jgi:hypothetical protein
MGKPVSVPYISTGEVATLQHEFGDDSVERRTLVAKALLAGAESAEVLGRLGDDIVKQVEGDTTGLFCWADSSARVAAGMHGNEG